MKKVCALISTLVICHVAYSDNRKSVYLVDFKCDAMSCKKFASTTLEELNAQFPEGPPKLARYHDLTSGSGIVLIGTDDPTLLGT